MAATLAAGLLVGCGGESAASGNVLDVLILEGTVVDGTGDDRRDADVGIRDGTIVFVGEARGAVATDTVDARGLVVAPGFIDAHSHTDRAIGEPENRLNEGVVRQGVTLIIGGPDGEHAPARLRELISAYEEQGVGTNYAFHVGHNGIRRQVMGDDQRRAPSEEDLDAMKALVRDGMEMGAVGLSTGLMYEPGMFSSTDEVVALTEEVVPYGGVYDSHDRDPVQDFRASTREVLEIGESAGVPAKVTHFKTVGLHNEDLHDDALQLIEDARARGLDVVSDQYPYDGAATGTLESLIVVPPDWGDMDEAELREALRDATRRERLRMTSEEGIDGGFAWISATGYGSIRITHSPDYPELEEAYLSELAEERGVSGFDLVSELILGAEEPVGITYGAVREAHVRDLMVRPWNMIASDGSYSDGETPRGHPRSTGTFPRVLGHYVREEGLLSLEEAIHKMTGFPASWHGWDDRGVLEEGMVADVVVFDPETVIDRSTWAEPHLYAEGVTDVLVNGVFVLKGGEMTGKAPGRFVRRAPRKDRATP